MNINRTYAFALIVVAVGLAGVYFLLFYKSVEVGDTLTINYIASLDTGEIIDTNIEKVALDDTQPKVWWFKLRLSYEPLKVVVGEGMLPPDVELALIGMHEGDRKEIIIPPERAAGYHDSEKVGEIPLETTLSKEEEVTLKQFQDRFHQDPVVDESYQLQGLVVRVLEVKEEKVRIAYQLTVGQEITIPLGKATISGETDTEYQITLKPSLGDVVYTSLGQGVVTEIRESTMVVDFNPVLAGETIHYIIWVLTIEKA